MLYQNVHSEDTNIIMHNRCTIGFSETFVVQDEMVLVKKCEANQDECVAC